MVLVIEVLVVAAVVFVVAALAVGWFDRMAPAPPDAAPTGLPERGPVTAAEVGGIRLNMAFRGYRMAEVDALIDRLAGELAWRDEELARRDDELVRLAAFAHVDAPVVADPGPGGAAAPTGVDGRTPSSLLDGAADWPRTD
ncbi:DivIVA domain-containing protein [Frankia sp. CNm7]|uniref:DivIVA domain-containing protein n=1 Tax=Frankia nepalensis TaxID=1836974 RepID=A0A937REF3_9ACTN|nr:DivIVA domain-containing protein [Frankia nepalensis]MBL7501388.1 DivIVA domain-containing protein [Frankia nepalensis]MBL7511915.1 DivIVA domain-containing protein [Frankia nepalensis]MBL7517007.1 DivIVA domain-containing protein [Frankia nepalensis]MBL7628482.1 DivIVA domain-containing protein [Frankia nepalensis]